MEIYYPTLIACCFTKKIVIFENFYSDTSMPVNCELSVKLNNISLVSITFVKMAIKDQFCCCFIKKKLKKCLFVHINWCYRPFIIGSSHLILMGRGFCENLVSNLKIIINPLHVWTKSNPTRARKKQFNPQAHFIFPNSIVFHENSLFMTFIKMWASEAWKKIQHHLQGLKNFNPHLLGPNIICTPQILSPPPPDIIHY